MGIKSFKRHKKDISFSIPQVSLYFIYYEAHIFSENLDILSALDQGLSLREVAKRVSVSYGTVQSISSKERRDRIMPKKGRPKAISKTLTRVCICNITTGQADTAVDI